tara:strand:+ start:910 stop:1182 length:273 start_codon:yes stop_codon:yes gene_type:complete
MDNKKFDDVGTFTLNPQREKKEDWHADWSGSINIEGKWYFLNAYNRKGQNGGFLSGKIGKEKKSEGSNASVAEKPTTADLDKFFNDDVPY